MRESVLGSMISYMKAPIWEAESNQYAKVELDEQFNAITKGYQYEKREIKLLNFLPPFPFQFSYIILGN